MLSQFDFSEVSDVEIVCKMDRQVGNKDIYQNFSGQGGCEIHMLLAPVLALDVEKT